MTDRPIIGTVDMHVHTAPDLRVRSYDDFQLCDAAVRVGARAIVLKSHLGDTTARAFLTNRYNELVHGSNAFTMFGSVTLNRCIGGIHPTAVENALKLGAKVVWLPTQSSRRHLNKTGKPVENAVDVVLDGKPVPALTDVFSLIREHNAVLGTGHLSPAETFTVVEAARKAGIEKIVITHPEWWINDISPEDQIRLVRDYNVILERTFAQNMGNGVYKSSLPDNVEIIREVGYRNVLCSTDGGQVENPNWEIAMAQYQEYLLTHGIPMEHVQYMTGTLPRKLLDID